MAKQKRALGRGLNSILGDSALPKREAAIDEIPIKQIEINPFQPRTEFDQTALNELADSIKVHGIIQPLTLRKLGNNKYQLIAGERRLRASQIAELTKVPAYIRTANDEQMLEMALIENIQREDLNPIEVALSYQRMIEELGLKQRELGDKVGKSREAVTNSLRFLKLPSEIQAGLREGKISSGHAKVLTGVKETTKQISLYQQIISENLSVRNTEEAKKSWELLKDRPLGQPIEKGKSLPSTNQIHLNEVKKQLEEKFANKVILNQKPNESGEIRIQFNSTEDLNRILEIMDM